MKLLPFFLIVFLHSVTFGQSAKKLNKKLLADFVLEQQKQDSALAEFRSLKLEYDSLKAATNKKADRLSSDERNAKRLLMDVNELKRPLKELGADLKSLMPREFRYDEIPSFREQVRPIKDDLKGEIQFERLSNRLYLDGLKKKEQNALLIEKLKEYQVYSAGNAVRYQELVASKERLNAFSPKLDSLSLVYQSIGSDLSSAKTRLYDKWSELRTNYVNKGPNGFPEAYGRIFWDVFPRNEELVTRDEEITKVGFEGGFDEVTAPMPVEKERDQEILMMVDEPASFPGGIEALKAYLAKNLRYPENMKEAAISGKVYLKFVVSETGEVSGVTVMRGIPGCKECDLEAIRAVKGMPKWIPGKNNGKEVKSYFSLPILFKL